MKKNILTGIILSLLCLLLANADSIDSQDKEVNIGSFRGRLPQGIQQDISTDEHVIIRFSELPDSSLRSALENKGIKLGDYVDNNSYYCRIVDIKSLKSAIKGVETISRISRNMKLTPLASERLKLRKRNRQNYYVRFHRGTTRADMLGILKNQGIKVLNSNDAPFHTAMIQADSQQLESLLINDKVRLVDFSLGEPVDLNEDASKLTGARAVLNKKAYSKPTGKYVNVGVWEGGVAYDHSDLSGRLTVVDTDAYRSNHATHVTGTILGAGTLDPQAKGMAPEARAFVYDTSGAKWDEMRDSMTLHDVAVSSHSWAYESGWYHLRSGDFNWVWWDIEIFGLYHEYTADADTLVYEYDFPIIKGVGNDRNDSFMGPHEHEDTGAGVLHEDLHDPNTDFDSITPVSCAKNIISVGAVTKDLEMTDFSSWGPTDDGRVKPDVVAIGLGLWSLAPDDSYVTMGGTSMSTPNTAGVAALVIDAYKRLGGKRMGAAMLKGLLIHGTRDLGPEGPDYMYGHGFVDTEMTLRVMNSAAYDKEFPGLTFKKNKKPNPYNVKAMVVDGEISNKEKLSYNFTIPQGAKEVRATLVWNDPAGSNLVNNLDVILKKKGEKAIKPWVLNPATPSQAARRKNNKIDNVESIRMENPAPGEWNVLLSGKRITTKSQKFVLIISAGDGNEPIELKNSGTVALRQFNIWSASMSNNIIQLSRQQNSFSSGDGFVFQLVGDVFNNAKYDNCFGAAQIYISMKNSEGKLVLKYQRTEDQYDGNFTQYSDLYYVPNTLPPGQYQLEATVTLHNDQKASLQRTITIQ